MDITPLIPADRMVLDAYGNGGFVIAQQRHSGNIIVRPDQVAALTVQTFDQLNLDHLGFLWATGADIDLLLIGCGPAMAYIPDDLRAGLKAHGITVEGMDTGAACRTYNVLLSEERRVAAVLFAVE